MPKTFSVVVGYVVEAEKQEEAEASIRSVVEENEKQYADRIVSTYIVETVSTDAS